MPVKQLSSKSPCRKEQKGSWCAGCSRLINTVTCPDPWEGTRQINRCAFSRRISSKISAWSRVENSGIRCRMAKISPYWCRWLISSQPRSSIGISYLFHPKVISRFAHQEKSKFPFFIYEILKKNLIFLIFLSKNLRKINFNGSFYGVYFPSQPVFPLFIIIFPHLLQTRDYKPPPSIFDENISNSST